MSASRADLQQQLSAEHSSTVPSRGAPRSAMQQKLQMVQEALRMRQQLVGCDSAPAAAAAVSALDGGAGTAAPSSTLENQTDSAAVCGVSASGACQAGEMAGRGAASGRAQERDVPRRLAVEPNHTAVRHAAQEIPRAREARLVTLRAPHEEQATRQVSPPPSPPARPQSSHPGTTTFHEHGQKSGRRVEGSRSLRAPLPARLQASRSSDIDPGGFLWQIYHQECSPSRAAPLSTLAEPSAWAPRPVLTAPRGGALSGVPRAVAHARCGNSPTPCASSAFRGATAAGSRRSSVDSVEQSPDPRPWVPVDPCATYSRSASQSSFQRVSIPEVRTLRSHIIVIQKGATGGTQQQNLGRGYRSRSLLSSRRIRSSSGSRGPQCDDDCKKTIVAYRTRAASAPQQPLGLTWGAMHHRRERSATFRRSHSVASAGGSTSRHGSQGRKSSACSNDGELPVLRCTRAVPAEPCRAPSGSRCRHGTATAAAQYRAAETDRTTSLRRAGPALAPQPHMKMANRHPMLDPKAMALVYLSHRPSKSRLQLHRDGGTQAVARSDSARSRPRVHTLSAPVPAPMPPSPKRAASPRAVPKYWKHAQDILHGHRDPIALMLHVPIHEARERSVETLLSRHIAPSIGEAALDRAALLCCSSRGGSTVESRRRLTAHPVEVTTEAAASSGRRNDKGGEVPLHETSPLPRPVRLGYQFDQEYLRDPSLHRLTFPTPLYEAANCDRVESLTRCDDLPAGVYYCDDDDGDEGGDRSSVARCLEVKHHEMREAASPRIHMHQYSSDRVLSSRKERALNDANSLYVNSSASTRTGTPAATEVTTHESSLNARSHAAPAECRAHDQQQPRRRYAQASQSPRREFLGGGCGLGTSQPEEPQQFRPKPLLNCRSEPSRKSASQDTCALTPSRSPDVAGECEGVYSDDKGRNARCHDTRQPTHAESLGVVAPAGFSPPCVLIPVAAATSKQLARPRREDAKRLLVGAPQASVALGSPQSFFCSPSTCTPPSSARVSSSPMSPSLTATSTVCQATRASVRCLLRGSPTPAGTATSNGDGISMSPFAEPSPFFSHPSSVASKPCSHHELLRLAPADSSSEPLHARQVRPNDRSGTAASTRQRQSVMREDVPPLSALLKSSEGRGDEPAVGNRKAAHPAVMGLACSSTAVLVQQHTPRESEPQTSSHSLPVPAAAFQVSRRIGSGGVTLRQLLTPQTRGFEPASEHVSALGEAIGSKQLLAHASQLQVVSAPACVHREFALRETEGEAGSTNSPVRPSAEELLRRITAMRHKMNVAA